MSGMRKLGVPDVEQITSSIRYRQEHFNGEDLLTSVGVVLLNYGDKYTEVACVGGEWSGVKGDLTSTGGVPRCPNGHVLTEAPGRKVLALVDDPDCLMCGGTGRSLFAASADHPGGIPCACKSQGDDR